MLSQNWGKLTVYQLEISVHKDAIPCKQSRRIPISLHAEVQIEIDKLIAQDVLETVDVAHDAQHDNWISPLVCARKKNKQLRLCLDLRTLNEAVVRPHTIIPTAEELLGQIGSQHIFSKLDAKSGFHQLLLSEQSRKLFTFCTPWGVYRYKRLPFGVSAAPEIFQQKMTEIFKGMPGVKIYFDDILVFGIDKADHDRNLQAVLAKAKSVNLQFNDSKCEYSKPSLTYLGHTLSRAGLQPDPDKCKAINEYPTPTTVKECQRFIGMATYLAKYISHLTDLTAPIRQVITSDEGFHWTDDADNAFKEIKKILVSPRVLKLFDAKHETAVYADASKFGLGAVLMQKDNADVWRPVMYASRTMTNTQHHYSQMEKEALAITSALSRFRTFLIGINFVVYTDHKPLQYIMSKPLEECPPRMFRFLLAMQPFNFKLVYKPGTQMVVPDAFSRAPLKELDKENEHLTEAFVNFVLEVLPTNISEIADHTFQNRELFSIFTPKSSLHNPEAAELSKYRHQLSQLYTEKGTVLMKGSNIYIPLTLRQRVLHLAHTGHPGVNKMRESLCTSVWWPNITKDCEEFAKKCKMCLITSDMPPPEPLREVPFFNIWECVGMDIFYFEGCNFLSLIDYRSRLPISITGSMAKIFEKMLLTQVNCYLYDNKLQSPIQFGYRKGYSTQDALLYSTETWRGSLDAKKKSHVAFLDLSKAFDSLNHTILEQKLSNMGFGSQSRHILMSFASERMQRVKINDTYSDWLQLNRGVPQGTVLGPLLFSLYINDICQILPPGCKIVQYADDTCLFVACETDAEAERLLSDAIRSVLRYFETHQLTLNVEKTEYLVIQPKRENATHSLKINDEEIISKTSCKYLGVTLDIHLSFECQVNKILANMAMGIKTIILLRNRIPLRSRLQLLHSLVLSHLQYSVHLLGAISQRHILRLNRQINWGLRCCYFANIAEHITSFRLRAAVLPVELQINQAICMKTWMIINKKLPAFNTLEFPNLSYRINRRTADISLTHPGKTSYLQQSFLTNGVKQLNALPQTMRHLSTTKRLKIDVGHFYLDMFRKQPRNRILSGWQNFNILHND